MKKKIKKIKTAEKKVVVKKTKRPAVKRTAKKSVVRKKPTVKQGKRPGAKKAAKRTPRLSGKKNPGKPIGVVTHFYNEISVAIVRFREKIPVGTVLRFHGATTDFKHPIKSMQYEHEPIRIAPKGKQIGIKVSKRVRVGDKVHRGA